MKPRFYGEALTLDDIFKRLLKEKEKKMKLKSQLKENTGKRSPKYLYCLAAVTMNIFARNAMSNSKMVMRCDAWPRWYHYECVGLAIFTIIFA